MFICALWGSETRLEYNLQTYIATEAFAAIIILGFMCKRVIDSFLKSFKKESLIYSGLGKCLQSVLCLFIKKGCLEDLEVQLFLTPSLRQQGGNVMG